MQLSAVQYSDSCCLQHGSAGARIVQRDLIYRCM
jgi:hypothetical protein